VPTTDLSALFRDVEGKFYPKCYLRVLQGAWIHTDIKLDETALKEYYNTSIDKRKVHFVVFSGWKADVYILSKYKRIKKTIRKVFGVEESRRFVV
jgi:hypothetical protein